MPGAQLGHLESRSLSVCLDQVWCGVCRGASRSGKRWRLRCPAVSSPVHALGSVAVASMRFLRVNGGTFGRMQILGAQSLLPWVCATFSWSWFGQAKDFPEVGHLAHVAIHGAPVHVTGPTDIRAATAYSNHSHDSFSGATAANIHDNIQVGRAFAFPFSYATKNSGLRLSTMGVAKSPPKIRVINDLTCSPSPSVPLVNADPDSIPPRPINAATFCVTSCVCSISAAHV